MSTLDSSTAVEYVLKCIPFLFQFHNTLDEEYRENIIAAAVILRQYEEMDHESDEEREAQDENDSDTESASQRANFLAITQGIIDEDRKSTRLNSSHSGESRMPSSA